jgi:ParB-like chromosome segregation protein Spo0J
METTTISINDLISPDYNPRQISDDEMQKLENSISEFGLVQPIVINLKNNHIIGGNQRYNALLNINMKKGDFYQELTLIKLGDIGLAFISDDLKVESDESEKALNLALNKISGEWDFEKLGDILEDLEINDFDVDLTGFDDFEVEEIKFNNDIEFDSDMDLSDDDLSEDKEDEKQIITCPYCHEEFEV